MQDCDSRIVKAGLCNSRKIRNGLVLHSFLMENKSIFNFATVISISLHILQCNHCRDLDLCRDISLHNASNEERRWACLMCETRYDLDEIQQVLLEALKKRGVGHCVQDLRCVKCKQVRFCSNIMNESVLKLIRSNVPFSLN